VQFDEGDEFAHLGGGERVSRQQRRLGISRLDVFHDCLTLAQAAFWRAQEGHLSQRRSLQRRLVSNGQRHHFFDERHVFFK